MTECRFDEGWYDATYPHILVERARLGLASSQEHYAQVGGKAGLYPSASAIPRMGAVTFPGHRPRHPLFPTIIESYCRDSCYLYWSDPQRLGETVAAAWRGQTGGHESYFELAANASGGEPHYVLHAALAYCQAGRRDLAMSLLSRLDPAIALSSYHDLLLCTLHRRLGGCPGQDNPVARFLVRHPPQAAFSMIYSPDVIYSPDDALAARSREITISFQYVFFCLYSLESYCALFYDGRQLGQTIGRPSLAIADSVQHFGPTNIYADVVFNSIVHFNLPGDCRKDLLFEIRAETRLADTVVRTFAHPIAVKVTPAETSPRCERRRQASPRMEAMHAA